MPFLPPLLHSTTESSVCRTHPKKSCTCHVSHKPFSCQKVHDKKVVVANHANPLQSSSNSHLSEKFKSLNPKLRSYKSLATTDQLHSAAKWELPEREKERERERERWKLKTSGAFFSLNKKTSSTSNWWSTSKKIHHPIDKIKLQKTTKKHILGFSNKTAILWTLLYSYNSYLEWSLGGDAAAATVVGVVMVVLVVQKERTGLHL